MHTIPVMHTVTAVPRSTLWHWWVYIISAYRSHISWLCLRVSSHLAMLYIHRMNPTNSCNNFFTVNAL